MINWIISLFYSYLHIKTITKTYAESRFVIWMLEDKTKIFVMNLSQEWNLTFFSSWSVDFFFFSFGPYEKRSLIALYKKSTRFLMFCDWERGKKIVCDTLSLIGTKKSVIVTGRTLDHRVKMFVLKKLSTIYFVQWIFFVLCIREEPPYTNSKSTYQ